MTVLAEATLTDVERRVLARLVPMLEREFGDDLYGVWLYGSRARAEALGEESDVDVMVVLRRPNAYADLSRVVDLKLEAVEAEGANPFAFSTHVTDVDWVASRREIRWFFIEAVERDKIVLAGPEGPVPGTPREDAVKARTAELLELARERLDWARRILETGIPAVAASEAYDAMLKAAHAALSEHDRSARTHDGTWALFSELYVKPGRFERELLGDIRKLRELRDAAHYGGATADEPRARRVLAHAERFVGGVERMLGDA